MPTRNINLTDYYDNYLAEALASGRYKNASEAVRAGLRLLEYQEREEEAKLAALRTAFQVGKEAFDRGDSATLHSDAEIDAYFDEVAQEADKTA